MSLQCGWLPHVNFIYYVGPCNCNRNDDNNEPSGDSAQQRLMIRVPPAVHQETGARKPKADVTIVKSPLLRSTTDKVAAISDNNGYLVVKKRKRTQDFRVSGDLKQHRCPNSPKPRVQCHLCGKTYKRSNDLRQHMRMAHKAKKVDLQLFPETTGGGYTCPQCGKSFSQKSSLKSHLQGVHFLDISKSWNCSICPSRFHIHHYFLAHTHPDPKDPGRVLYICSICGKTYGHRNHYTSHWTAGHKNDGVQCAKCGKLFTTVRSMKFHSQSCSVSPEEQRTCPAASCGKLFASLFERLNHERVVHKGLSSTRCYFCSKTFRFTSILENHVRIHSRERPFRCLKCGKDFPMQDVLKTHMDRVCGGDESKKEEARKRRREAVRAFRAKLKYTCHLCDKRFGQKPQLLGHKKREHLI